MGGHPFCQLILVSLYRRELGYRVGLVALLGQRKLAIREAFDLFGRISGIKRSENVRDELGVMLNLTSRLSCIQKGFHDDARCMRRAFA